MHLGKFGIGLLRGRGEEPVQILLVLGEQVKGESYGRFVSRGGDGKKLLSVMAEEEGMELVFVDAGQALVEG